MSRNKTNILKASIAIVFVLIAILIFRSCDIGEQGFFDILYCSTNNSSIAVIIGFAGIYLGYLVYQARLFDKYYSEYIGLVFNKVAIRKKEVDLRKEKNKMYQRKFSTQEKIDIDRKLLDIDVKRLENEGKIESIIHLIKKLNRQSDISKIEELRIDFENDFKRFTEEDVEESSTKCYSKFCKRINDDINRYKNKLKEILK